MSYRKHITEQAQALVRRFETRDPFRIAEGLGIQLLYADRLGGLKGMYRVLLRNRFIILNTALSHTTACVVCAHELGHDQLHRAFAKDHTLHEIMLYDMSVTQEYEANLFAAELLLDDETFLEYATQGYTAEQMAQALQTEAQLIAFKAECLQRRGYPLQVPPHRSDFLKD